MKVLLREKNTILELNNEATDGKNLIQVSLEEKMITVPLEDLISALVAFDTKILDKVHKK